MNYLWQKFLVELKYHNKIILEEFSIYILWLCQLNLSAWVIRKNYVELCSAYQPMYPQLRKLYVPLSCPSLVVY